MREIKFRVWHADNNEMLGPFDLTQNPIYWADKMRDGVLMQYTGLKDVNGHEIYEGDVLEERYLDEIDTLKVFYFGSGFMVEQVYEPNADFNLDGCDINKLYVVGNIYKK